MILTRRKFIQRLGYMMAGGLIVPYVPKVFYSIPKPIEPPYRMYKLPNGVSIRGPLTGWEYKIIFGAGERQNLGTIPIGDLV